MVNLGLNNNGQIDQQKPEESNEYTTSTNSLLNKHIRNFHQFKTSFAASGVKSSNLNHLDEQRTSDELKGNESTRWKFVNKQKNLLKLNSQSNLIYPLEFDLDEKLIKKDSNQDSKSNSQQTANQFKSNKINDLKSVNKLTSSSSSKIGNSVIPTVQINSTPSEKLLNPFTLYQMYHQDDIKFKSNQNIDFQANLDDTKLKISNNFEERRTSNSFFFGREYITYNLFNDNLRAIDFVLVYDRNLHEYRQKFLTSKNENLSISIQNSQESLTKSLSKSSLNNKNDEKDQTAIEQQSDQLSQTSNSDDKRSKFKLTKLNKTNETKDLQRLNANDLEMIEELDNNQDEEIEYMNTKIIDSLNQRQSQITTLARKNLQQQQQTDELFEIESTNQSDELNEIFNEALNDKLSDNKRRDIQLNSRQRYLAECCKRFEENLLAEGLELEYTDALFVNTNNRLIGFLKIHCPWDLLCRYAELMKLKMPMKQIETSTWRVMFDDNELSKSKFTAPYSRDKEYLFDIPADKRLFFNSAQRAQIVEFILKRKSFSPNLNDTSFGISKLLIEGAYISAYPLHEGILDAKLPKKLDYDEEQKIAQTQMWKNNELIVNNSFLHENTNSPRVLLLNNWASLQCIFTKQPLDEIRNYYGVKIALYFAFLGFYTSMLVPASLVGICCFLFGVLTIDYDTSIKQICNGTFDHLPMCPLCNVKGCDFWRMSETCTYVKFSYLFDNLATVLFTIFMSLWSTVYLEMWKRYSNRITYRWDLSTFDTFEEYPRPEYLAKLTKAEKKKLNLLTKAYEPYVPFWKKQLPYTILSSSVVVLLILVALASVVGVIIYRVSVRAAIAQVHEKYSSIFTAVTAALINLFCILIFNQVYSYVSFYLTELEMPRTQSDFDNSLTLKMYLLQFVNYYSSIFYIAFFKGRFMSHPGEIIDNNKFTSITQEECGTGGCLLELSIQLAIIMIGKQFFGAIIETFVPWFQKILKYWRLKKNDKSNNLLSMNQYESDYLLAQWQPQSLFYEYLEMILQFGFISIFSACFTLGPLFALINNLLEIRLDAKKMITTMRRPVSQRVKNIGIWYRILDIIGKLSVFASALIIAFTSEFIPKLYHFSKHGNLNTYLNNSLSYFNATEITKIGNREKFFKHIIHQPHYCMYQGYRHPPSDHRRYEATQTNWELFAIKLAFVVIFENVVVTLTMLIRYLIPDVPRSLRQKIRQHLYLTNELIIQQEIKRAKKS